MAVILGERCGCKWGILRNRILDAFRFVSSLELDELDRAICMCLCYSFSFIPGLHFSVLGRIAIVPNLPFSCFFVLFFLVIPFFPISVSYFRVSFRFYFSLRFSVAPFAVLCSSFADKDRILMIFYFLIYVIPIIITKLSVFFIIIFFVVITDKRHH